MFAAAAAAAAGGGGGGGGGRGWWSQWPRRVRRGSPASRLLGLRYRIPPEGMDVCLVSVVSCLCFGLITRPEKSYRLRCV